MLDTIQSSGLDPDVSLEQAAMTKTEFMALAEKHNRDSAGSGFLEWGKHETDQVRFPQINEGLWSIPIEPSSLVLGRDTNNAGVSRTTYPIALVNGVTHVLNKTGKRNLTVNFPPAPNGTKTYDSATGVVVDFTKDVDPKYGDVAADTNEAVARAFEGVLKNGDLRLGTAPWSVTGGDTLTVENNVATFTVKGTAHSCVQRVNLKKGTHEFSFTYMGGTSTKIRPCVYCNDNGSNIVFDAPIDAPKVGTRITLKFDTHADGNFGVYPQRDSGVTGSIMFADCSVRSITNKVITTRKDLVFLETWHEALDTHDLFNPLGNVQFSANSFDGITGLSNTLVAQGYSAFGEWDTTTKGYGKRWSTMSTAEKIKAVQNPENNIYCDAETKKYIQVKYRIRVIEGVNNNPSIVTPAASARGVDAMTWGSRALRINRQEGETISKDFNPSKYYNTAKNPGSTVCGTGDPVFSTHLSFALPICLVQRLNQGAYHPVWNPEGCDLFLEGWFWYHNKVVSKITSSSDCFIKNHKKGNIANSGSSGRPDQYKFYDAIYAGQVEDLRLNANKQYYSRLLEDGIRKAVAGKTRGKGKVPFTKVYTHTGSAHTSPVTASLNLDTIDDLSGISSGDYGYALSHDNKWQRVVVYTLRPSGVTVNPVYPNITLTRAAGGVFLLEKELSPEYDSLPWVDIIGSPENIAATFPNGVVGQWNPITPVDTSFDYPLLRKNYGTSTTSNPVTLTTDNGATWIHYPSIANDKVKNTVRFALGANNGVALISYGTLSNFTAPADNGVVVGDVGDVVVTVDGLNDAGNRLNVSTTGNIGKSGNANERYLTLGLDNKGRIVSSGILATNNNPEHHVFKFGTPQNNSPAVKTLYTLTSKDGLLYMQYHGNELKYKADAAEGKDKWGDITPATPLSSPYGVIPIINGEGTKTDLNGETVKTFCHHEMIPIGIADCTESATATIKEINFYSMRYVPESLVQHYDEVDGVLTRKPFYFENGGHIDDEEVVRHTEYENSLQEWIEGLVEESESKVPQLMI